MFEFQLSKHFAPRNKKDVRLAVVFDSVHNLKSFTGLRTLVFYDSICRYMKWHHNVFIRPAIIVLGDVSSEEQCDVRECLRSYNLTTFFIMSWEVDYGNFFETYAMEKLSHVKNIRDIANTPPVKAAAILHYMFYDHVDILFRNEDSPISECNSKYFPGKINVLLTVENACVTKVDMSPMGLRYAVLSHGANTPMDVHDGNYEEKYSMLQHYIHCVKFEVLDADADLFVFGPGDSDAEEKFAGEMSAVHRAFKSNFNTPAVLDIVSELLKAMYRNVAKINLDGRNYTKIEMMYAMQFIDKVFGDYLGLVAEPDVPSTFSIDDSLNHLTVEIGKLCNSSDGIHEPKEHALVKKLEKLHERLTHFSKLELSFNDTCSIIMHVLNVCYRELDGVGENEEPLLTYAKLEKICKRTTNALQAVNIVWKPICVKDNDIVVQYMI